MPLDNRVESPWSWSVMATCVAFGSLIAFRKAAERIEPTPRVTPRAGRDKQLQRADSQRSRVSGSRSFMVVLVALSHCYLSDRGNVPRILTGAECPAVSPSFPGVVSRIGSPDIISGRRNAAAGTKYK
ncbi:hypothetical protein X777_10490 [Ooceraea biroi]|uniref:Uncharacterized protein n=1 Tax=Ooceraea biroi TaxID=2015173 RepID=A0A026W479_OOCBI|nr:hypothetical protein X777_10490 [Ooceraea biroi]